MRSWSAYMQAFTIGPRIVVSFYGPCTTIRPTICFPAPRYTFCQTGVMVGILTAPETPRLQAQRVTEIFSFLPRLS